MGPSDITSGIDGMPQVKMPLHPVSLMASLPEQRADADLLVRWGQDPEALAKAKREPPQGTPDARDMQPCVCGWFSVYCKRACTQAKDCSGQSCLSVASARAA